MIIAGIKVLIINKIISISVLLFGIIVFMEILKYTHINDTNIDVS